MFFHNATTFYFLFLTQTIVTFSNLVKSSLANQYISNEKMLFINMWGNLFIISVSYDQYIWWK